MADKINKELFEPKTKRRLMELAGLVGENNDDLLEFVKNNKNQIAALNPNFTQVIKENDVELITPDIWSKEDYFSAYEDQGYTYEKFLEDWNTFKPTIVACGIELSTVFITDKPITSMMFANTVTGNDAVFFGTIPNKKNAFKKYEVNGKTLYIVWGIPDPGS